ncbi:MAG: hypothetical protein P1U38_03675 [Aeromicrobium sp.]|uniref:hypothetical protein n=1 Tax=Aeromicrobium sp. TaxID=1871063 RepID=UPI00262812C8|nr:hypothetical protein [Aeromicrobium sp.]MDF1703848.1 hypothetical protein [Aeromicrobium sp.]
MGESTHDTDALHLGDESSLEVVAAARCAAADRLVTPWWYHPVLGALFAGYAVSIALGDTWVLLGGIVVFFAGLALLVSAYRRKTGIWLSGHQNGPASRWAGAMGVVGALGIVGAILLSYTGVSDAWVWAVAVAMGVAIVPIGRTYDRVLRADLRGER